MKPLSVPYVPEGRASAMLVSCDMPIGMVKAIKRLVPLLVRVPALNDLPAPVNSHPDMQMVFPTEGVIVHVPNLQVHIVESLRSLGFTMVPGEKSPAGGYPSDIPYNVAIVGDHAFCNTRFVDGLVLQWLKKAGKTISHVNQGYTKCSVCILNEEAMITSDVGISHAARGKAIDVLLIPPQRKISIPRYEYGFIGGATGLISRKEMVISGDMRTLDSGEVILEFMKKHGITPISLGHGQVMDLGSLIPLCTV